MKRQIKPVRKIGGTLSVPGDKSIAHRAALISILSEGDVKIINFPDNADCASSLAAAGRFGVKVEKSDNLLTLIPPSEVKVSPDTIIECNNSGTTARLLAGIASGLDIEVTLDGDDSLRSRPMKRIIEPLTEMGAELFSEDGRLPLRIRGHKLLPFEYQPKIPSAQVKSALLLAGLASSCSVTIREERITRDHTELMIEELGEGITVRKVNPVAEPDPDDPRKKRMRMPENFKKEIKVSPRARIGGGTVDIPGDISTAAFFFAAAAISGGTVTIPNLGLNPTRSAFLTFLRNIGCKVDISDRKLVSGESRGTVTVTGGKLAARKIAGETTVALIDEIPIVAVIAAFANGTTLIRDAGELKVKESDRLKAIADNLDRMGAKCGLLDDGLAIEGGKDFSGADFATFGDHRIAMAFSIASLFLVGPSTIDDDRVVNVSCPNFFDLLSGIVR